MKNYVTCSNVLSNVKGVNPETWETIYFEDDEREKAFEAFKSFVASTARGDRRRRIYNAYISMVRNAGILSRLWYYPETGEVEYCCGQSWPDEMAVLRDLFDYKK